MGRRKGRKMAGIGIGILRQKGQHTGRLIKGGQGKENRNRKRDKKR